LASLLRFFFKSELFAKSSLSSELLVFDFLQGLLLRCLLQLKGVFFRCCGFVKGFLKCFFFVLYDLDSSAILFGCSSERFFSDGCCLL
jgi:hypothetical protein